MKNTRRKKLAMPLWVTQLGALPADDFFMRTIERGVGLTYGDARLASGHSRVAPTAADVSSRFSRRVSLKAPLASAAMDTVTCSEMAIEMAARGGIGVIHMSMTPEEQAREVGKVKHRIHGFVRTPITTKERAKVSDLLALCREKRFKFRTFPVLDGRRNLVGLVGAKDIKFLGKGLDVPIGEVMTPRAKLRTAPEGTTVAEAYKIMRKYKVSVLPLVSRRGKFAGMYLYSDVERTVEGDRTSNLDKNGQLIVAAAIGVSRQNLKRAALLVAAGANALVIDTAHGDTDDAVRMVKTLKRRYPDVDIVVGNVSEPESAWRLAAAGADAIKVGQGPGSICTTRKVAGIGCPQLLAIWACARAIRDDFPEVVIIADGGITDSGDIVLALAAGASSVMMGRALAGANESPGEEETDNGIKYKKYRGMGSLGAMRASAASRARYGQRGVAPGKFVPEGIESRVPATGPVADTINRMVGGLRSGMGYIGAHNIAELRLRARFRRMSSASMVESAPHSLN